MDAGRLTGQDSIGVRVGKIINRIKVAKRFELSLGEATLARVRLQTPNTTREGVLFGVFIRAPRA